MPPATGQGHEVSGTQMHKATTPPARPLPGTMLVIIHSETTDDANSLLQQPLIAQESANLDAQNAISNTPPQILPISTL